MFHKLLLALILLACHAAAFWAWCYFTQREATGNAKDILANGAADDLRKGYHSRRTWARFWPWLGLSLVGSLPLLVTGWLPVASSFLSLGILLAAYFARFFTPALNLARGLEEFRASPDSASWPDAACWKEVRVIAGMLPADQQDYANHLLQLCLSRVWLFGRLTYALGMVATLLLAFLHY